jgi:hypothetical protein
VPKPEALELPEAAELAQLGRETARTGVFEAERADRLARRLFGMSEA